MLQKIIELLAFIKVTRDVLDGTDTTSLNETLDCINYLKAHSITTDGQAIAHYNTIKHIA